jgi:putative NADPH-quinone reductase
MRFLIVYAHPSADKGHNAQVRKRVESWLSGKSLEYKLIDLYRDGFDPCLPETEWEDHKHVSKQVQGYQQAVKDADRLIFIYPVWWYTYPAILKGFFDRVFTPGFAYNMQKVPLWMKVASNTFRWFLSVRTLYPIYSFLLPIKQHLRGKKALVINTFGGDEAGFRLYGHAPQYAADRAVLEFCGIAPVYRVHWYNLRKNVEPMPPEIERRMDEALSRLCS